ncbi:TPA: tail assembly protein, partial [Escherichia coli]
PVMKAVAERSWLSGGRGKKNKKIPQSCGDRQRLTLRSYFCFWCSGKKNINAEKLLAPQSVCENVKIFRSFIQS